MKIPEEYVYHLITGLIIILGAVVHATMAWQLARRNKDITFTWVDYVILLPLCIFSGWVFVLFASLFFDGSTHTWIAGAMGSYLGVSGTNLLFSTALDIAVTKRSNLGAKK